MRAFGWSWQPWGIQLPILSKTNPFCIYTIILWTYLHLNESQLLCRYCIITYVIFVFSKFSQKSRRLELKRASHSQVQQENYCMHACPCSVHFLHFYSPGFPGEAMCHPQWKALHTSANGIKADPHSHAHMLS